VKEITANVDRVQYWLSCGAEPTSRVAWLFGKVNILPEPPLRPQTKYVIPKHLQEKKK
jgi:ribosomal protein S16